MGSCHVNIEHLGIQPPGPVATGAIPLGSSCVASFDNKCPTCKKEFMDDSRVLRHMNNPRTRCQTWFEYLESMRTRQATFDNSNDHEMDDNDNADDDLTSRNTRYEVLHPNTSSILGTGPGFMDQFNSGSRAGRWNENVYHPFSSKDEWGFASWLLSSGLSMRATDELLALPIIQKLSLSFMTAKTLRARLDELPKAPEWKAQDILFDGYQTEKPITLFYRNPLEIIQALLQNPIYEGQWDFTPRRTYDGPDCKNRIYSEWMTSDSAWSAQSALPPGGTLLGVTLSSDKTNISAMTGDRVAHPLLLTLANLPMGIRMKSTYHALPLIALLPCPKFVGIRKSLHGVLENRLIHHCLDIICKPLKVAASRGALMNDSLGRIRCCFPMLAAYIVDTPEAAVLAGVGGKTSHLTVASHKRFGDHFRHPTRLATITLAQIEDVAEELDPWKDLELFVKESRALYRLNGVHLPFWRNWALPDGIIAEPSHFLTPEPLHHWHKQFWDHDAKWCIRAVGSAEIDFRFSLLQPCIGFRHFKAGISSLKQVTGRDHRNVQRYIIPIIAGAVSKEFLLCIRALSDFRYLAQSRSLDDKTLAEISNALTAFHQNKHAILNAKARVGKGGKPLDHFFIPKLELLHNIAVSIPLSGPPIQWSADPTERAHIDAVKTPSENTNNGQYGPHICQYLDRDEKRRLFDLGTAIHEAGGGLESLIYETLATALDDDGAGLDGDPNEDWVTELETVGRICGPSRKAVNLFANANALTTRMLFDDSSAIPRPLRTFSTSWAAFHLNRRPDIPKISIDSLAEEYNLPDLRPALLDFLHDHLQNPSVHQVGGRRRAQADVSLPFDDVVVWHSVRIQTHSLDDGSVTEPRRLTAIPPCGAWSRGRYDSAIFVHDSANLACLPSVGLSGFTVAQIRLIIHPIWDMGTDTPLYLAYVQRFDIVPQLSATPPSRAAIPDPGTGLYVLKRAVRANGSRIGDVIPLSHCRMPVQLVPRFGKKAHSTLTCKTSMERSREFFLNGYFDKDIFQYLRSSRP